MVSAKAAIALLPAACEIVSVRTDDPEALIWRNWRG
jgi:hypothetical protein